MATSTNVVVLCGRLVDSMQVKTMSQGYSIGNFTLAVDRDKKTKDNKWESKPSFIDCTLYGKTVTNLQAYLYKGKQVCITGYIEQDRWDKDGQKFSRIRVVVTNLQLTGNKNNGSAPQTAKQDVQSQPPTPQGDGPTWSTDYPADLY